MIRLANLHVKKNNVSIAKLAQLTVEPGEKVQILGQNGSGKTTILKVIAGLEPSYSGQFNNQFPKSEITYVHQEPVMLRGTVRRNILYGSKVRGIQLDTERKNFDYWSDVLNLKSLLDQQAHKISGGEKKKTALARALMIQPKLLLLDEPLAELDEESGSLLIEALTELTTLTIITVSPTADPKFNGFRQLTSVLD
ncbi:MAG: ATP-binding cassette domain-containing protein [Planctomycetota bacterium]|nr:ATP-binding cassette domain-containing protein [Planctomycetota bacterium]